MNSVSEFLHMGGYAFYVWSSYAFTAVCLGAILMWSRQQFRKTKAQSFKRALHHKARRSK